jgi:hypothetical protein
MVNINENLSETIELVYQTFKEANCYGLEIEIMASAMKYLQENPGTKISTALQNAMIEWDI